MHIFEREVNGHRYRIAAQSKICMFRSEEHTSELQSHLNLVCRLLLEKKKTKADIVTYNKFCTQLLATSCTRTHIHLSTSSCNTCNSRRPTPLTICSNLSPYNPSHCVT